MGIAICFHCGKPIADAFHDFEEVCECVPIKEQKAYAKKRGWNIKFPRRFGE
jgi:hypothetical protein